MMIKIYLFFKVFIILQIIFNINKVFKNTEIFVR